MTHVRKQVLIATVLLCNFSLSSVSSLESHKYLQSLLEDNSSYSDNLLNSKARSTNLSSFEPGVGIRLRFKLPPIKLPWQPSKLPKVPTTFTRPKPVKPIKSQPIRKINLTHPPSNYQQASLAVHNAISNSKQKQSVQRFLNDMPRLNASLIEQNIETDVTAKIQRQLLRSNLQIQDLTDQGFQEAADRFYTGRNAVESVLRPRYATRNGFLTPQDQKDAQLAARQAIEKRNRDKRNVVMSSTTITIITGFAVTSGTQRVRGNNSNQTNINPRSSYPVNRLPKIRWRNLR
jgi:hypothetical protein